MASEALVNLLISLENHLHPVASLFNIIILPNGAFFFFLRNKHICGSHPISQDLFLFFLRNFRCCTSPLRMRAHAWPHGLLRNSTTSRLVAARKQAVTSITADNTSGLLNITGGNRLRWATLSGVFFFAIGGE